MTVSRLGKLLSLPLLGAISLYRIVLSPLLGRNCRFQPSCSEYARLALQEHGAWCGSWLACKRIARCHPWGDSGYDPLPPTDPTPRHRPAIMARETLEPAVLKQREQALDRAYAFISRGNREGGFAHLDEYAATEPQTPAVKLWFFHAMLGWNQGDAPLYYAQRLLGGLLDAGEETAAMKVCLRCFQQNPAFRPKLDDVPRLRAAALKLGNHEVASALPP